MFTDASKTEDGTSFAVVAENSITICKGILPAFTSIFTAEAFAIYCAIEKCENKKTIIFTDSLSSVKAIKNINNSNEIIESIRDKIISKKGNLKIAWIPGHQGIHGNEIADAEAKLALKEPLITFYAYNKRDIKNHLLKTWKYKRKSNWLNYNHIYTEFNPNAEKALYPKDISCKKIRMYIRLRLGHTSLTHKHIITNETPPECHLCNENQTLTVSHLTLCRKVKSTCKTLNRKTLSSLLTEITAGNIEDVYYLMSTLGLINLI